MSVIKNFTIMNIENTQNSESHQTCLNGRVVSGEGIANTQECFVQLWLRLERTRRLLAGQYKRYCIRNILRSWFGQEANDDFIWEVCFRMSELLRDEIPVGGNDQLPPPSLNPRRHRELLRAIVAIRLGTGVRKVNLKALDAAYSIAFPKSTPINVNKKKRV